MKKRFSQICQLLFAAFRRAAILLLLLAGCAVAVPALADSIHEAARKGNLKKVQTLLEKTPALVFSKNRGGDTPLILAAFGGFRDVAELLLANKADINAKNDNGDTPLLLAVSFHHKAVVELLLANRANVNDVNSRGDTPLHMAAYKGYEDLAEILLANKADINAKNDNGDTPLLLAVQTDRKDVTESLLTSNADVNARDNNGYTPLLLAAYKGYKNLAELLLANQADVDVKNPNGDTPLHLATFAGHKDVVELLLANRADVNVKDNEGATPLRVATLKRYDDVAELLRHHGSIEEDRASTTASQTASLQPDGTVKMVTVAPTESVCQIVKHQSNITASRCRAYPGNPRPAKEVAVLKFSNVKVTAIDGKSVAVCGYPPLALRQRHKLVCGPANSVEFLPGQYSIEFAPIFRSGIVIRYEPIVIDFHAEAGKTYEARQQTGTIFGGRVAEASWAVEIK